MLPKCRAGRGSRSKQLDPCHGGRPRRPPCEAAPGMPDHDDRAGAQELLAHRRGSGSTSSDASPAGVPDDGARRRSRMPERVREVDPRVHAREDREAGPRRAVTRDDRSAPVYRSFERAPANSGRGHRRSRIRRAGAVRAVASLPTRTGPPARRRAGSFGAGSRPRRTAAEPGASAASAAPRPQARMESPGDRRDRTARPSSRMKRMSWTCPRSSCRRATSVAQAPRWRHAARRRDSTLPSPRSTWRAKLEDQHARPAAPPAAVTTRRRDRLGIGRLAGSRAGVPRLARRGGRCGVDGRGMARLGRCRWLGAGLPRPGGMSGWPTGPGRGGPLEDVRGRACRASVATRLRACQLGRPSVPCTGCDSRGGTPRLDAARTLPPIEHAFYRRPAVRTYAPAGTESVLDRLLEEPSLAAAVTHHAVLPAREAITAPFPAWLDARIVRGLEDRGITSLYSHQAEAVEAVHAGEDIVVVTPDRVGQDAVLRAAGAPGARRGPVGAGALPVPDEGARAGPGRGVRASWPAPARCRSRRPPTTATRRRRSGPRSGPRARSSSPTRTCSTPRSCPTTRSGSSSSSRCGAS